MREFGSGLGACEDRTGLGKEEEVGLGLYETHGLGWYDEHGLAEVDPLPPPPTMSIRSTGLHPCIISQYI